MVFYTNCAQDRGYTRFRGSNEAGGHDVLPDLYILTSDLMETKACAVS